MRSSSRLGRRSARLITCVRCLKRKPVQPPPIRCWGTPPRHCTGSAGLDERPGSGLALHSVRLAPQPRVLANVDAGAVGGRQAQAQACDPFAPLQIAHRGHETGPARRLAMPAGAANHPGRHPHPSQAGRAQERAAARPGCAERRGLARQGRQPRFHEHELLGWRQPGCSIAVGTGATAPACQAHLSGAARCRPSEDFRSGPSKTPRRCANGRFERPSRPARASVAITAQAGLRRVADRRRRPETHHRAGPPVRCRATAHRRGHRSTDGVPLPGLRPEGLDQDKTPDSSNRIRGWRGVKRRCGTCVTWPNTEQDRHPCRETVFASKRLPE